MTRDEAWERLKFQTAGLAREYEASALAGPAIEAARTLTARLEEHSRLASEAERTAADIGHRARVGFGELEQLEQRLDAAGQLGANAFRGLQSAADADRSAQVFVGDALDRLQATQDSLADYSARFGTRQTGPWPSR